MGLARGYLVSEVLLVHIAREFSLVSHLDLLFCRFHVDKFSSAHVYIRLPEGVTFDTIPEVVIKECSTLVKHNSIEGMH